MTTEAQTEPNNFVAKSKTAIYPLSSSIGGLQWPIFHACFCSTVINKSVEQTQWLLQSIVALTSENDLS